jgi:hypothetical protein
MTLNRIFCRFAIATLLLPGIVSAAVVTSINRAAFQSAIVNQLISSQNFDALATGSILDTLDGVTYVSSAGSPVVTNQFLTSTSPNGLGRTGVGFFLSTDNATFVFDRPITAFAIDINTFANQSGDYRAVLSTGDVVSSLNETFPNTSTGQFIGFVSDQAFSSIVISANQGSSSPNRTYTLDTLVYGSANAVQVLPEPAALSLVMLALSAALLATKRRILTH